MQRQFTARDRQSQIAGHLPALLHCLVHVAIINRQASPALFLGMVKREISTTQQIVTRIGIPWGEGYPDRRPNFEAQPFNLHRR